MIVDIAGKKFGKLTAIRLTGERSRGELTWLCICDCGKEKIARRDALKGGYTTSCGCLAFLDRNSKEPPSVRGARWIPIGHGKFTLVDSKNYKKLSKYRWCLSHKYVQRRSNGKIIWMHYEVLRPPTGKITDHKFRDTLDNRRSNLRISDKSQNTHNSHIHKANTSGYRGVSFHSQKRKWRATIMKNRKYIHLGLFDTALEAAKKYDKEAVRLYGEFAAVNSYAKI